MLFVIKQSHFRPLLLFGYGLFYMKIKLEVRINETISVTSMVDNFTEK